MIPARDAPTNDQLIEAYLRRERMSAALRLLWAGLILATLGVAGSCFVYRWFVYGGVLPNLVMASPFALVAGVPLSAYGCLQLAKARR